MNQHEGVNCDSCRKSNFSGKRYKCLLCFDYDLCEDCYDQGKTTGQHSVDHPVQCLLTKTDMEMYFGGESIASDRPQSYTCPLCNTMGFSETDLHEHVTAEHSRTYMEVICPLCVGLPRGYPNLVTDDLAGHFSVQHRLPGSAEVVSSLDELTMLRQVPVRRIPMRGSSLSASRPRRAGILVNSPSSMSSLPPLDVESVDRIAELFFHLSEQQPRNSYESTFQQFQMQIQHDRDRPRPVRPQHPRLPQHPEPSTLSTSNSSVLEVTQVRGGENPHSPIGRSSSVHSQNHHGVRLPGWNEYLERPGHFSPASSIRRNNRLGFPIQGRSINNNVPGTPVSQPQLPTNINENPASSPGPVNEFGLSPNQFLQLESDTNTSIFKDSRFFLGKFLKPKLSEEEGASVEQNRADRSHFVQAILLSTLMHFDPRCNWVRNSSYKNNDEYVNYGMGVSGVQNSDLLYLKPTCHQEQQTLAEDLINTQQSSTGDGNRPPPCGDDSSCEQL